MGIVFVLLPASLLLALLGVSAFVWAARSRQFDDLEVSAARILFERDEAPTAVVDAARAEEEEEGGPPE